jgi:hypothetical protein
MPHAFGDDERVAAKGDGDVVVPTRKATALVVVEPELSLQVLVDALGSPALHDEADELLPGDAARHAHEEVVGRLWLALAPLDEKLEGLLLALGHSSGDDATQGEARPELLTGAAAPGAASKAPALVDAQRHVLDARRTALERYPAAAVDRDLVPPGAAGWPGLVQEGLVGERVDDTCRASLPTGDQEGGREPGVRQLPAAGRRRWRCGGRHRTGARAQPEALAQREDGECCGSQGLQRRAPHEPLHRLVGRVGLEGSLEGSQRTQDEGLEREQGSA